MRVKLWLARPAFFTQIRTVFFLSGFSAIVLEVVYAKLLRYWAGNTAFAVAAVLCAYMAGLALGSFAAGKWLLRRRQLLVIYGVFELTIGLYSLALPWLTKYLEPAYLSFTIWLGADTRLAVFGHFLAAVILLMLPTLLMGATFPIVVRAVSGGSEDRADIAQKLYTSNLSGAALGALFSDFLLIRFWGLGNSLIFVATINTGLAFWVWGLRTKVHAVEMEALPARDPQMKDRANGTLVMAVALASGFLVLFQEIVWTHAVGRFLDSTVYGFAVALFAVIAGLGLGAALVARKRWKQAPSVQLRWALLSAGLSTLILIPFWDDARALAVDYPLLSIYISIAAIGAFGILVLPQPRMLGYVFGTVPALFVVMLVYRWQDPAGAAFWIHHGVVLSVSVLFMLGTAVVMGMVFPLTLQWLLESNSGGPRTVAHVYAANTVGSVAGIVVATFLVLPRTGVEWGGRAVGLAYVVMGLILFSSLRGRSWFWAFGSVPVLAWVLVTSPWDYSKTLSALGHSGKLVYGREDLNGGVTTVLQNEGSRILYVNGLLQGGIGVVVGDQVRAAVVPLLYTHEFDRAMVIGVGSGQTAGVVGLFPFKSIEVVDFSPSVVEAASRLFADLNFSVFRDPRVKARIADGRHYLMTHPAKLDLLTIEVSRLWLAGEGDLYTREFYELSSARLNDRGVLQQWVPLFDLSVEDTLMILRTVRAVFPHVAFYMGAESGMIVASRSPLILDYAGLRQMEVLPALRGVLLTIGQPSIYHMLGDCVLTPEGVDALLARESRGKISTDLWPHLEYSNAHFYLGNYSSKPLRLYLLQAEPFQLPSIAGADETSLTAIRGYAMQERHRLLTVFPPH